MALSLSVVAVILGYLLGAVPCGMLVCRAVGRDPRQVGSGRTGGTNVYRTAGFPAALVTVAGDVLKGYAALWLADRLFTRIGGTAPDAVALHPWALALVALAVILGHNYSVFLDFHGGAGSSPNVGALLWFDPALFFMAIVVAALSLFGLRLASVASLVTSLFILLGIAISVHGGVLPTAALVYGVGQLVLITWALRSNIARLRAGTERRIEPGLPRPDEA